MEQNQRPHSRQKTTGQGSASAGRGRKVSTGSRPVGSGGRTSQGGASGQGGASHHGGSGRSGGYRAGVGGLFGGGKLSLKKILILAVVALVVLFVLKKLGGGSGLTDLSGLVSGGNTGYEDYDGSSDYSGGSSSSNTQLDLTVSPLARNKRVTPLGGGKDTVTLMVYMCGTDLESKYGMATKDLREMLKADISDNVNIIVETGGCKSWQNKVISSSCNQIYKLENGGLKALEKNFGTSSMTDPKNLASFIEYCEDNYPADRNMLILWDHGGGSLSGYGYDEKNASSSSMTLSKLDSALKSAGCTFDFIGFDACLMATLENALVCEKYADYLIGSEETEPGTGWYYTNWITALSENTSIPTVKLAKIIADDFVSSCCASSSSAQVTLSVVDLAELDGTIPDSFREFAASTNDLIRSDNYKQISDARAGVRQFSKESKLNQVDLADLADRIGTAEAKSLAKALRGCVKYNRATMSRCSGLSIFFPYETVKNVKSAVSSYEAIGLDDEYSKCIQSFASLEYGGQIAASATQSQSGGIAGDLLGTLLSSYAGGSASTSPLDVLLGSFTGGSSGSSGSGGLAGSLAGALTGALTGSSGSSSGSSAGLSIDPSALVSLLGSFTGRSMPEEYDWVDTELIADNAESIISEYIDPSHIFASEKDGKKVLSLTDDEWSLIQTVELNLFVKDGDGYIDMGLDNTFDWYGDDLLLEFDGTWLTLNGNACAYYLVSDTEEEDGSYTTVGRIPALLNGSPVNLRVVFDAENPEGCITGAYPLYADGETDVSAKGNVKVNPGDTVELLCDYYDLDGNYSSSWTLGTTFIVPEEGLVLTNLTLDNEDISAMYRLTDIYGNYYWVEI